MIEHSVQSIVGPDGVAYSEEVVSLTRVPRQLHNADWWGLTEAEGIIYDDLMSHIWPLTSTTYQYQKLPLKSIALFLNNCKTPIRHFCDGATVDLQDYFKTKETAEFIYHLFDSHILATTVSGQAFVEELLSHGSKRRLNIAHQDVYTIFGNSNSDGVTGDDVSNISVYEVANVATTNQGWELSGGGTMYLQYASAGMDIVFGEHNGSTSSNATIGFTVQPTVDAVESSGYLHLGRIGLLHADGSSGDTYVHFKVKTSDPTKLESKVKYDDGGTATGELVFPHALWPPDGESITILVKGEFDYDPSAAVTQPLQIWYQTSTWDSGWLDMDLHSSKAFRSPKKLDYFSFRAPTTGHLAVQSVFIH